MLFRVLMLFLGWLLPASGLFANTDFNTQTEQSIDSYDPTRDLVDRLLKRIAWDQVSTSDSESDDAEENADKSGARTSSDEFYSAQQSEEKLHQGSKEPTLQVSGTVIGDLIRRFDLVPLKRSKYWQEYPDTLPYSQCILTDTKGNWEVGTQASLFIGQFFRNANGQTLFCYSDLEKTAFMIPIQICNSYSYGLSITLAPFRKISSKLVKLRDLSPAQIFGFYNGIGGGLGLLASLSGAILRHNHSDVELQINSFFSPGIIDVSVAYKQVEIKPRVLHDFEVYQLEFLQSMASAQDIQRAIESNQFMGTNYRQKQLKEHSEKLNFIKQRGHEQRFSAMADYWIHSLDPKFGEEKFFAPLDWDRLSALKFVKRKKL